MPTHAGHLGRHGGHHERRRQRERSARHAEPGGREREPATLGDDSRRRLDARVGGPLRLVEGPHRGDHPPQRPQDVVGDGGALDRLRRDAQAVGARAVEPLRPLEQRRVAAITDVRDDRCDGRDRLVEPDPSHPTSRSTGTTRIERGARRLERGQQLPHLVGLDRGVHRDLAVVRKRQHGRSAHARQHRADRGKHLDGRVHHHVASAAPGDDTREHQLERLDDVLLGVERGAAPDQHRLRGEQVSEPPQAVGPQRRAGGDEVDDRVGEPEPRRRLDRAADRHELDVDAALGEEPSGRDRIRRRDPETGEVVDGRRVRAVGHGHRERATAEAELEELLDAGLGLDHEVRPRDPEVDDAVLDVLGDVVGPDEQQIDRSVRAGHDERPLRRLEREPRIGAQAQRGFGHAALRRHCDGEPAVLTDSREPRAHPPCPARVRSSATA